jgi:hypothetical protein
MTTYRLSSIGTQIPATCAYGDPDDGAEVLEGCWGFNSLQDAFLAAIGAAGVDGYYRPEDGYHDLLILEGDEVEEGDWHIISNLQGAQIVKVADLLQAACQILDTEEDDLSDVVETIRHEQRKGAHDHNPWDDFLTQLEARVVALAHPTPFTMLNTLGV